MGITLILFIGVRSGFFFLIIFLNYFLYYRLSYLELGFIK